MDNNDLYEPMLVFARKYSEALAPLNREALELFSNNLNKSLLNISEIIKIMAFPDNADTVIAKSILSINESYRQLINNNNFGTALSDLLTNSLPELHIETLCKLANTYQSQMIRDLSSCFANANYDGLVNVINQTLKADWILAPDISFIKTAQLTNILKDKLIQPKGFANTIKYLNKSTADDIVNNNELKYNTSVSRFVTGDQEFNVKELNSIFAGKQVLNYDVDDLFDEQELMSFCSFLSRTPMLAFRTQTGKKIYSFLEDLYNNNKYTIGFDNEVYYHCRSRNSDTMPFTFDQMLKAPHGLPWAGRFNQVGRSNYYFANTQAGAETEIKKHLRNDDVLQTVKLKPIKGIRLLDLSGTLARGTSFLRYLRFSLSDIKDNMPREYLIPCYVSDCCKAIGFDGIKYYGSKEYSNYVSWSDGYFEFAGMCQIVE